MSRMSEYVVRGVMDECPETFVKRVAILLERAGALYLLAEGVPTSVDIMDNGELFRLQKKDREVLSIDYTNMRISEESRVVIPYKYKGGIVYVRNKSDAKLYSNGHYVEYKREAIDEFTIPTERILDATADIPLEKAYDYGLDVHYI